MTFYDKSVEQLAQYRAIVLNLIQRSVNANGDILDGSNATPETIDFLCELLNDVKTAQGYAVRQEKSEAEKALETSTPHLAVVS
jgi:hypothetical protein